MSSPKLPRPKTMMLISSLFCIALVPLVYAVVNRSTELQQHYKKIANEMTESDRRQLNHNFEVFRKLSPEQQEDYRRLHAQLQGEHRALKPVLDEYIDFLRSLDPVDRAEIERQKSFSGKMNAIENVVDRLNDESQRYQELLQQSFENNRRRSNWRNEREQSFSPFSPLNADEIAGLTRVLESHQTLSSTKRILLNSLEGADRLAQILSIALTESGASENKAFFSSQVFNELIAVLSEERVKWFQKSREFRAESERKFEEEVKAGKADADDRPHYLRKPLEEFHEMVLIGSCLRTFHQALDDAAPPPEEMPAYMKKLPADLREELVTKHSGDLYDELVKHYHDREGTPLFKATKTIQELASKRMPKGRGRSGPGRSGGGPGRPGDDRERPEEFPRERRDGESNRDPRGAGFPDRFPNFRNDRREEPKSNESSTQSAED